jgi:hypothetical protein
MKKKTKLYAALFSISMLFSIFAIPVLADTFAVTVIYKQPSDDSLNTYEIEIPSTIKIAYGETTKQVPIGISDDAVLVEGYNVNVHIDMSSFTEEMTSSYQSSSTLISGKKLIMQDNPDYYYVFDVKDSTGHTCYRSIENLSSESTNTNWIAKFTSDATDDVYMTLVYVPSKSTDKKNTAGGTYTGTLNFIIEGSF